MWNQFNTADYEGQIAETVTVSGYNGDRVNAYMARPLGSGPYPSIVLIHHLPGWDELYREFARRFAHHGYVVCSPDLFARFGQGTPDDIASAARGQGGVSDDSVLADAEGAAAFLNSLPYTNGKVGIIGSCSGGTPLIHGRLPLQRLRRGCGPVGRTSRHARRHAHSSAAGRSDRPDRRAIHPRCWGSSATTTSPRPPKRLTSRKMRSSNTARTTTSIATTGPDTASGTTTAERIVPNRRWTRGKRYSPSSAKSCPSSTSIRFTQALLRVKRLKLENLFDAPLGLSFIAPRKDLNLWITELAYRLI